MFIYMSEYNVYLDMQKTGIQASEHPSINHPSIVSRRSPAEAVDFPIRRTSSRGSRACWTMILNRSKLGGEASPSLRWLRLCRRPVSLHRVVSTFPCLKSNLEVYFQNKCLCWPPRRQQDPTWRNR